MKKTGKNACMLPLLVMLMLWLLTSTGCGRGTKTIYVAEDSKPVALHEGEIVPFSGWLLTPGALVDLMECCQSRLEGSRP